MSETAERIRAYVENTEHVSGDQRQAVYHSGNFFLTACPGSGKTRTVGVRVAYWASVDDEALGRPRRLAATSYTNTAVREITAAADAAGQPVGEPHFVGTLHRFLLRYVVRPFARGLMGAGQAPRLIVDTDGRKYDDEQVTIGKIQTPIPIWDWHWRADGTLSIGELPYALRNAYDVSDLETRGQEAAKERKAELAKRGLISMSDALYWAMRPLDDSAVAAIVAARFDELIVDEVQDTSDVQQRCLTSLQAAGLRSIVYVGDMEQAIYGFAHADPAELQRMIDDTVSETLELRENWRSSQAICDVAYRFSSRIQPDVAVGPDKDAGNAPELLLYDPSDPQQVVEEFAARLETRGLDPSASVVLCRWSVTVDQLGGETAVSVGKALRLFVDGAAAAKGLMPMTRDTIRKVEQFIANAAWPDRDLDELAPSERLDLRLRTIDYLQGLPDFDAKAKDWAKQARDDLKAMLAELSDDPLDAARRLRAPSGAGEMTMERAIGGPGDGPAVQTIHSVKGESHVATLLIGVDDPGRRSMNSSSWLGQGPDPEEVRVAYVALSRARRYSALALPIGVAKAVSDEYLSRGFRQE